MLTRLQIKEVIKTLNDDTTKMYVIDEFEPCIIKHAKRMNRNNITDFNDLLQEAKLGLLTALERFNGTEATFVTYVETYIKGYIQHVIHHRKNMENATSVSLNQPVSAGGEGESVELGCLIEDEKQTVFKDIADSFDYAEIINVLGKIDKKESDVVKSYFLQEKTLEEIGDDIQYSKAGVRAILMRGLNNIRLQLNSGNSYAN